MLNVFEIVERVSIVTPTVFVDCDGVLADFNAHVIAKFGTHPNSFSTEALWETINADPEFYLDMPLMPDGMELWTALRQFHPIVLTGCPKSNFDVASQQKTVLLKRHFGAETQVIACLSREKHTYLRDAKDVLIDDRSGNIKKWIRAGGIGIRHRDTETTLRELQSNPMIAPPPNH